MNKAVVFHTNIEKDTLNNEYYRRVLFTTNCQQIVVMSLKPGEDISGEIHRDHDQFIRIECGTGMAVIDEDAKAKYDLSDGSIIMIPAGIWHQIINTSKTDCLKLYTIYSPPEHPVGQIDINKSAEQTGGVTNYLEKYYKYKYKYIQAKLAK